MHVKLPSACDACLCHRVLQRPAGGARICPSLIERGRKANHILIADGGPFARRSTRSIAGKAQKLAHVSLHQVMWALVV